VPALAEAADQVVWVDAPHRFGSVGEWYLDFTQVTDAEVTAALADG
jgi:putative phosphoribosyl transferase